MKSAALSIIVLLLLLRMSAADNSTSVATDGYSDDPPIPENICYGELGWVNTTADWYVNGSREVNPTPEARDVVNTVVRLYTPGTSKQGDNVNLENFTAETLPMFNCSLDTKFIFHGFGSSMETAWIKDMKQALLSLAPYNVFLVQFKTSIYYWQDAVNIRVVALEIIFLIKKLVESYNLDLKRLHLIGHSLGAHLAGYVGEGVKGIGRITGLDPAEPLFRDMPPFVHLDPTDANFVDVIHTDTATSQQSESESYGMRSPVGHLDFYPNNGTRQPGCSMVDTPHTMFREGVVQTAAEFPYCNHARAYKLFIESLSSDCAFLAVECPDYESFLLGACRSCGSKGQHCASMGLNAERYPYKSRTHVKMYLKTSGTPPYCMHVYWATVKLPPAKANLTAEEGDMSITLTGDLNVAKSIELTLHSEVALIPFLNVRIPDVVRGRGGRTFQPGQSVMAIGFHRVNVGRIQSAHLTWRHNPSGRLGKLFPCFRCHHSVNVSEMVVRIVAPLSDGWFTDDTELCPDDDKQWAEIQDGATVKFVTSSCKSKSNKA